MSPRVVAVLVLVLSTGLSGCFGGSEGGDGDDGEPTTADWPRCEHPWPCADGSEWPENLTGPFEVLPAEQVLVESHDGTLLSGHVWRPDVPEGVAVPVIVYSSPYFSTRTEPLDVDPLDPTDLGSPDTGWGNWPDTILGRFPKHGFALLLIAVRGTGESGGCLGWGGIDEQKDHGDIIDWAAEQDWSNGRVGFWGISYMGATAFEAALQGRDALKAIWAGGLITNWYLQGYDLQGLSLSRYYESTLTRFVGLGSPPLNTPLDRYEQWLPRWVERACPETPENWLRNAGTMYVDDRNPDWFAERRYIDHFDEVTAAVHVPHGLEDNHAHRYQEDVVWDALSNAPTWFLLGQWGHTINFDEQLSTYPYGDDDWNLTFAWFDFWLKGIGDPPRIGTVDYQDSSGTWHESTAWPPVEARLEALYLADRGLSNISGTGSWSFHAAAKTTASEPLGSELPGYPWYGCGEGATPDTAVVFETPELDELVLAGNPYALLDLEADRPGGGFVVRLVSFEGEDLCSSLDSMERFSRGGVDLRFHEGNLIGQDFPVDTRVQVRVDFYNVAHHIPAGHRLALVVFAPSDEENQPWSPTITLHGGSHLVVPVVNGTTGGEAPTVEPPPRPFTPAPGPVEGSREGSFRVAGRAGGSGLRQYA